MFRANFFKAVSFAMEEELNAETKMPTDGCSEQMLMGWPVFSVRDFVLSGDLGMGASGQVAKATIGRRTVAVKAQSIQFHYLSDYSTGHQRFETKEQGLVFAAGNSFTPELHQSTQCQLGYTSEKLLVAARATMKEASTGLRASMRHPNIVRTEGLLVSRTNEDLRFPGLQLSGQPALPCAMVMEYASLGDLHKLHRIARTIVGPDDSTQWWELVGYITWQVAAGLAHIHAHHVAHTDMKFGNVLVHVERVKGRVQLTAKVCDFDMCTEIDCFTTTSARNTLQGSIGYGCESTAASFTSCTNNATYTREGDMPGLGMVAAMLMLRANNPIMPAAAWQLLEGRARDEQLIKYNDMLYNDQYLHYAPAKEQLDAAIPADAPARIQLLKEVILGCMLPKDAGRLSAQQVVDKLACFASVMDEFNDSVYGPGPQQSSQSSSTPADLQGFSSSTTHCSGIAPACTSAAGVLPPPLISQSSKQWSACDSPSSYGSGSHSESGSDHSRALPGEQAAHRRDSGAHLILPDTLSLGQDSVSEPLFPDTLSCGQAGLSRVKLEPQPVQLCNTCVQTEQALYSDSACQATLWPTQCQSAAQTLAPQLSTASMQTEEVACCSEELSTQTEPPLLSHSGMQTEQAACYECGTQTGAVQQHASGMQTEAEPVIQGAKVQPQSVAGDTCIPTVPIRSCRMHCVGLLLLGAAAAGALHVGLRVVARKR